MNIEGHAAVDGEVSSDGTFTSSASAGASGCANLNAGVHVNAGARGAIAGLFDKDISYDIFDKEINVFDVSLVPCDLYHLSELTVCL